MGQKEFKGLKTENQNRWEHSLGEFLAQCQQRSTAAQLADSSLHFCLPKCRNEWDTGCISHRHQSTVLGTVSEVTRFLPLRLAWSEWEWLVITLPSTDNRSTRREIICANHTSRSWSLEFLAAIHMISLQIYTELLRYISESFLLRIFTYCTSAKYCFCLYNMNIIIYKIWILHNRHSI